MPEICPGNRLPEIPYLSFHKASGEGDIFPDTKLQYEPIQLENNPSFTSMPSGTQGISIIVHRAYLIRFLSPNT